MAKRSAVARVPGSKTMAQLKGDDDFDLGDDAEAPKKTILKKPEVSIFKRSFSKTQVIISDVYKLTVAMVWKQVGVAKHPDIDPKDWKEFEHTHIFRTFSTEGTKHDKCMPTGGHFHEIEWEINTEDPLNPEPIIKSISGPMHYVQKRKAGKWAKVAVPVNDFDDHTHDLEYIHSQNVEARVTNTEAQKVIAFEAQKGAPVAGVIER